MKKEEKEEQVPAEQASTAQAEEDDTIVKP